MSPALPPRGRGAASNPPNRFERLAFEPDPEAEAWADPWETEEPPGGAGNTTGGAPRTVPTQFFRDATRTIIARNQSPDIGYDASINPYRGCTHGCIYCYARTYHEFLGMSAGLDFETRIMVKERAPELLRRELALARWRPQVIAMCGVTDAYQPVERHLKLSRQCLEVLADFRNPVSVVTKSRMVARDADLLGSLARRGAASVCLSVTTLDAGLARQLEPRASAPSARLEAVAALAAAGIPVGVMVAPVIPGLTDHEIPAILKASREAGARHAFYTVLRLPGALGGLFAEWLERAEPGRHERVLRRVRGTMGGGLDCPEYGTRLRGTGQWGAQIAEVFAKHRDRLGMAAEGPRLSTDSFARPGGTQLTLFD
jgi:DNA repair photolyase